MCHRTEQVSAFCWNHQPLNSACKRVSSVWLTVRERKSYPGPGSLSGCLCHVEFSQVCVVFRCVRKITKSDYQLHLCVCPPVRMQQLGSHRTAFHEIFWPIVSQKPVETRFFLARQPPWARASSFTRFIDHTQRRTTLGRTPLDE